MTQHDLAQAPSPAQRKPRLGGARGRSQAREAQPGPAALYSAPSSPLLLCLSFLISTSWTCPRPGRVGPTQRGRVPWRAHPQRASERAGGHAHARTHTHTHSAPEAMARASPGRRLWRPAGNGYSGWQTTDWAEARLSRVRGEQGRQTRACRSSPAAPGWWAGRRRCLLIHERAAAATTQTTAADASLRQSREEPNHRKERCFHLSQSVPALGTPARPSAPLPSNPRTRANQKICLRPGSRLRDATRLVTPRQLAATLRFLDGLAFSTNQQKEWSRIDWRKRNL